MTVGLAVRSLSAYGAMVALGLAAGLASPLPLVWAFMRAGAHSIFAMSREAAWRIHIAMGILALFFGLAHGVCSLVFAGRSAVTQQATGFFGLLLMISGVFPALVRLVAPKCISYDQWKLLHFVSLLGYLLTLLHLLGHATKGTTEAILVCAINFGAAIAYFVQLIYVKIHSPRVRVVDKLVADQHVYLRLHAPGFNYIPGQWARLSIPSISWVAHPFTIVPDSANEAGHVQFLVKVTGQFTKELAAASLGNARVSLQGPYGNPPLADSSTVEGAVFVVGGVGVTPALSLVQEASRRFPGNVRLYWNMRSIELLHRCAPLLERYLAPEQQCIRVTGGADLPSLLGCRSNVSTKAGHSSGGAAVLPLGAETGRAPLKSWLATVSDDLSRQKVRTVLLFVCGPPTLVKSAQEAVAAHKETSQVHWRLHVERFEFLAAPASKSAKVEKISLAADAMVENNVVGKTYAAQGEPQLSTVLDAPSQQDIPYSQCCPEEREADHNVIESLDTSVLKTDSSEFDLCQQRTLQSVWTQSGDLVETTETYRQSCMGFDWKANEDPILAAEPDVYVHQSLEGKEDQGKEDQGMSTWLTWRANIKQLQQTRIPSSTSASTRDSHSNAKDLVEP
jgi:predicted ferric reductase